MVSGGGVGVGRGMRRMIRGGSAGADDTDDEDGGDPDSCRDSGDIAVDTGDGYARDTLAISAESESLAAAGIVSGACPEYTIPGLTSRSISSSLTSGARWGATGFLEGVSEGVWVVDAGLRILLAGAGLTSSSYTFGRRSRRVRRGCCGVAFVLGAGVCGGAAPSKWARSACARAICDLEARSGAS